MSKIIKFGPEAREKLQTGIDILAKSVVSTLGPNGRNVIIAKPGDYDQSTKDGVTVAKNIELEDPIEDLGCRIVKQASIKTANKAGDGTTTSTLLASEMAKEGLKMINSNSNAINIKRGMDEAVIEVVETLREQISTSINEKDQLEQVARVSSNGDEEVSKLIVTALNKVGTEGVVTIESSQTPDTYLETVEGMQFDRGYKSHFFVTDNDTMSANLAEPLIFIANQKFTKIKELLPLLEKVSTQDKPLLIVAEDLDHEALATLIVNKMRGTIKVCAVKAPDFGDRRKLIMDDIAILTGGEVFDPTKGMNLKNFSWDWLGTARNVTVNADQTTIVDGAGGESAIENRLKEIQAQINHAPNAFAKEKLQERLAKLTGGIAIINIGGHTETGISERKDRVEDALYATKAAIEEGIVPGGGSALLFAREGITHSKEDWTDDVNVGKQIVYKACGKPFEQILKNAGYTENEIYPVNHKIGELGEMGTKPWFGYNVRTRDIIDMGEAGIIDPTKVTRTALENAVSVAGTLLTTEVVVVDDPEAQEEAPNPMAGMQGMF